MKNQLFKKFTKFMLWGFAIVILLIIPEALIAEAIFKNDEKMVATGLLVANIVITLTYIVLLAIKAIHYQKSVDKIQQEEVEEARKTLSSEFSIVYLTNPGKICPKMLECQAKIGDDGKIICKIQTDFETEFDSYEKFLECFQIVKEE